MCRLCIWLVSVSGIIFVRLESCLVTVFHLQFNVVYEYIFWIQIVHWHGNTTATEPGHAAMTGEWKVE